MRFFQDFDLMKIFDSLIFETKLAKTTNLKNK